MLVLTRKLNQTIAIDKDITIEVLQIKGNQIRLGINAPSNVAVKRLEIVDRVPERDASESEVRSPQPS